MSLSFTPDELGEIREFVDAIRHTVRVPTPEPERKPLPVTVILHDGLGDVAVSAHIASDGATRVTFPAGVKGDQLEKLLGGKG